MLANVWRDSRRLFLTALALSPAAAQSLVDASHLAAARAAFDESASARPLKCQISAVAPALNFSLRFQTGFSVKVPMSQFHGTGHGWDLLLRVTPDGSVPVFLATAEILPDVPDTNVDGEFTGTFVVGEGAYQVDALLKDDAQRVCKSTWRIEAKLQGAERSLQPSQPPETVAELAAQPATAGARQPKLARLTVLLHAASLVPSRVQLQPDDVLALSGSLESLLEQLPARSVHVVIFSLDQGAVLYEKDDFNASDLDRAAKTIGEIQLGAINYKTLQNSASPPNFAAALLRAELAKADQPDAVIFVGPYAPMPSGASATIAKPAGLAPAKLFYIQYHPYRPLNARPFPWESRGQSAPCIQRKALCDPPIVPQFQPTPAPDAISLVTKASKGETIEVRQPQDFAVAIRRILGRL